MKRNFLAVLIVILLSSFVFSQDNEAKDNVEREISICHPGLTEKGRQSSFHFTFRYTVQTAKEGLVKEVTYFKSKYDVNHLAITSHIIPCIKKWKLTPSKTYLIYIHFGTTGENSLQIRGKNEKIKILL